MGWDAPWHWVVLAILVIALFGYKKLPDASRSVGRSLRIFKSEIKGLSEDDQKRSTPAELPAAEAEPAPSAEPPAAPERTPQMTPQSGPAAPPPAPPSGSAPPA